MAFQNNNPTEGKSQEFSLIAFFQAFPNDKAAEDWFVKTRWPEGIACPRCGSVNVNDKATHPTMPFRCRDCDKRFSPKTGTVMEASKLSYQTWALALYLFLSNIKGVASTRMAGFVGISQPAAWYLNHRIRKAMEEEEEPFTGTVEVDETYVGGKEKNKHADKKLGENWRDGKAIVIGAKERKTNRVVAQFIAYQSNTKVQFYLKHNITPWTVVYTDGAKEYRGMPYYHAWVNHSGGEYVRGDITTNGIESFWAGLKRGYMGVYHWFSRKHLHRYVTEFTRRHNLRGLDLREQQEIESDGEAPPRSLSEYLRRQHSK